jgi:hypothetical protein
MVARIWFARRSKLTCDLRKTIQLETAMPNHIYSIGATVIFRPAPAVFSAAAGGTFTVKAQMPALGESLQYRIKRDSETFERVVLEDQLSPVASTKKANQDFFRFRP